MRSDGWSCICLLTRILQLILARRTSLSLVARRCPLKHRSRMQRQDLGSLEVLAGVRSSLCPAGNGILLRFSVFVSVDMH